MRPLLPLLLLALLLCTCDRARKSRAEVWEETVQDFFDQQGKTKHVIRGLAMGSYYHVTYLGDSLPRLQASIDSLLDAYNQELSAWVPTSRLNAWNASENGLDLSATDHFFPNLDLALTIAERTGGAYDPTVAPLVNYWGFGTGEKRESADYDPAEITRLLAAVGTEHLTRDGDFLRNDNPATMLDLNASAKGYGVDLIHQLLDGRGRPNHLVDVGGEMRAGGDKEGTPWRVAIRLPDEDRGKIASAGTLPLSAGRAIATSGNYLNYYEVDGETFSHTINPRTGLTERNRLLSASVLGPDCATADAYATACMVLGPKKALELIENTPNLEGYFLIRAANGVSLETMKSSGIAE